MKLKDNHSEIPLIEEIEKSVILSSPIRMTIMLLLEQHKNIIVSDLQKLIKETPGNLDYHIKQLEKENYVIAKPGLFRKRVLKTIEITEEGIFAVKSDIAMLMKFLENFNKKEGINK